MCKMCLRGQGQSDEGRKTHVKIGTFLSKLMHPVSHGCLLHHPNRGRQPFEHDYCHVVTFVVSDITLMIMRKTRGGARVNH